jgi:hypothetical protein
MTELPGGFWRVVAEGIINGQLNKPFFGSPYLKLGQCVGAWAYMFELGGVLGARHAARADAFVSAFLGMSGEAGAGKRFLNDAAKKLFEGHSLDSMKFWQYVAADIGYRVGYTGDWLNLMKERGAEKFSPKTALANAWEHASSGAALGVTHPGVLRAMFERTYAPVAKEKWEQAYGAGLDIGPKQPRTNYKEAEETENKSIMEYCRQFRPKFYSVFSE